MPMKFHYRTITSYRELPPRVIYTSPREPKYGTEEHLAQLDEFVQRATPRIPYDSNDVVSMVFANRMLGHELSCRQFAELIEERRAMHRKHLSDVARRLEELLERKPWRGRPNSSLDTEVTDVERQILDLEKQKRALEVALWRDTQELRSTLLEERREQEGMKRRLGYLAGVGDAA
ncbi:MAG: hypothetical protein HY287_06260 [Planctomycetes bacterium]|nr:hypothetical protein [Planctomycetota bacterium]MBI3833917.1 hypothetical protein [Planctomycetota bacterium]